MEFIQQKLQVSLSQKAPLHLKAFSENKGPFLNEYK